MHREVSPSGLGSEFINVARVQDVVVSLDRIEKGGGTEDEDDDRVAADIEQLVPNPNCRLGMRPNRNQT